MKTIFAMAVLAVLSASLFAFDLGNFPKGTWTDEKWNGNWEIGVNSIKLFDAVSGDLIYDFKDVEPKVEAGLATGVTVSFTCPETHRSYVFNKPTTDITTDITLTVDPDWTDEDYKVTMKMKR